MCFFFLLSTNPLAFGNFMNEMQYPLLSTLLLVILTSIAWTTAIKLWFLLCVGLVSGSTIRISARSCTMDQIIELLFLLCFLLDCKPSSRGNDWLFPKLLATFTFLGKLERREKSFFFWESEIVETLCCSLARSFSYLQWTLLKFCVSIIQNSWGPRRRKHQQKVDLALS